MTNATVLVVDDDPNIRELLQVNLTAAGYAVAAATNGHEAVSAAEIRRPDLIILDIMMPGMDGWEVCKFIRDDPRFGNTRILMLTAKGTEKDRMIGRAIFKADEYMVKPFDIDMLLKVIEKLLHE